MTEQHLENLRLSWLARRLRISAAVARVIVELHLDAGAAR